MAPRRAFYAVARGHKPGVYPTWPLCQAQVNGYANARYKKFDTEHEANAFVRGNETIKVPFKAKAGRTVTSHAAIATASTSAAAKKSTGRTQLIPLPTRRVTEEESLGDDGYYRNAEGYVVAYTDGACSSNGRLGAKAGWGVYWADDHPNNSNGPVHGEQTNNRGELIAAIRAVDTAIERGVKKLCIKTDSQLMINSMNDWMRKWKRNGWKTGANTSVKNKDLLVELDEKMQAVDVKFVKVAAHCGIHGNEMADRLAVNAAANA
ncbi:unnamed protein product, partial [Mesorhabditis spiculigera]